jgi:hypothetical protein
MGTLSLVELVDVNISGARESKSDTLWRLIGRNGTEMLSLEAGCSSSCGSRDRLLLNLLLSGLLLRPKVLNDRRGRLVIRSDVSSAETLSPSDFSASIDGCAVLLL